MKKWIRLITMILIMVLLFCSCSKNKDKETDAEEDLTPTSSLSIDEEEAAVLNEKVPVILYFGDEQQTKLVKEIRYINIAEAKKGAETLASIMVKELIAGPKAHGLKSVIPEGTSLRGPVKIEDRVATVDLTKEFVEKHPGGDTLAELSVYSIVNTLTELKDIERVKIIINGKETKNFAGKIKLDADFPRNDAIVDKEVGLAVPEAGNLIPIDGTEEIDTTDMVEYEGEDPLE
ncbi:MAG: GerMN domain-containing protein [Clostridiaceae bacterium]|nr:GerMN domain-containing protein [Clostridiaceae bacterium]